MPFGEEKGEAEDWLRYTGARPPMELPLLALLDITYTSCMTEKI